MRIRLNPLTQTCEYNFAALIVHYHSERSWKIISLLENSLYRYILNCFFRYPKIFSAYFLCIGSQKNVTRNDFLPLKTNFQHLFRHWYVNLYTGIQYQQCTLADKNSTSNSKMSILNSSPKKVSVINNNHNNED